MWWWVVDGAARWRAIWIDALDVARASRKTVASENMHRHQLFSCVFAMIVVGVESHGSMIYPPPRSAHGQKFDDRNKCGCASTPKGCYSNASAPGDYCGLGCIGEACLYYQIGCYQSCPECSYEGKTLYPVPEDLKKAGNCPVPPAPTLGGGSKEREHALRTYNIDNYWPLYESKCLQTFDICLNN